LHDFIHTESSTLQNTKVAVVLYQIKCHLNFSSPLEICDVWGT